MKKYILILLLLTADLGFSQLLTTVPASKTPINVNLDFRNTSGIYNGILANFPDEYVTTTQMNAILPVKLGRRVFNTTTNKINYYDGSAWVEVASGNFQTPISLTTTGTSGEATFSGNILNIPNYVSIGTTNLTTSQSATDFTISSDTGIDATVPLGDGTLAGASLNNYTTAEQTKLAGIATGATVNSSDATLLARENHTGTQLASTISDLQNAITNNTEVLNNTAKISFDSASSTRLANTSGTNTGDTPKFTLVKANATTTTETVIARWAIPANSITAFMFFGLYG